MAVFLVTTLASSFSEIVHFDLDMGHTVDDTSEVTSHPVEAGANIVDHVRENPKEIVLVVFVTNTPIRRDELMGRGEVGQVELGIPKYEPPFEATPGSVFRQAGALVGAGLDALFGGPPDPVKASLLLFSPVFDRVQELEAQLERLKKTAALLNVITPTRFHENMVITGVSLPRDEFGGATFTISLRQVRLVSNAVVSAPTPLEPRGAPGQSKGSQATKAVTGKDATSAKSWAASLVDAAPDAASYLFGG